MIIKQACAFSIHNGPPCPHTRSHLHVFALQPRLCQQSASLRLLVSNLRSIQPPAINLAPLSSWRRITYWWLTSGRSEHADVVEKPPVDLWPHPRSGKHLAVCMMQINPRHTSFFPSHLDNSLAHTLTIQFFFSQNHLPDLQCAGTIKLKAPHWPHTQAWLDRLTHSYLGTQRLDVYICCHACIMYILPWNLCRSSTEYCTATSSNQ